MPKLNLGRVVGPQGPQGVQGPEGPQGPQGLQGEKGESATINGQQAVNIVSGNGIEITQQGETVTISTEVDAANRSLSNLDTPQQALFNLGAGVRPTLIINGDFRSPINQRGQLTYEASAAIAPCLDMCSIDPSDGSVKLDILDGFIRLTQLSAGSSRTQALRISAPKENFYAGETITFSALVRGTGMAQLLCLANGSVVDGSLVYRQATSEWALIGSTFVLPSSLGSKPVRFYLYADTSGLNRYTDWLIAKAEEGQGQTLAYQGPSGLIPVLPQPDTDYGSKLLKCQRYYQLYSSADNRPAKAVDCRPVMRIDPTQGTIVIDGVTYYYNDASL